MHVRFSGLRGVPGGCAGTENPIQASRSPQPIQRRMRLSWSRGLLLRIVRVADRCLGLAGDWLIPSPVFGAVVETTAISRPPAATDPGPEASLIRLRQVVLVLTMHP